MVMQTPIVGPAAELIDFGFAVKLPLSKSLDNALGIRETDPFSVVAFLKVCYVWRRPGFVWIDEVLTLPVRLLTLS